MTNNDAISHCKQMQKLSAPEFKSLPKFKSIVVKLINNFLRHPTHSQII